MRIGTYSRDSKNDGSQNPQNQLTPLRDYAKAIGGEIVAEYVDMTSGSRSDRVEFLKMLKDADNRKFDLLLIWSLDRLSREGISNTLGYVERLRRNGVSIKSLQESWLDTRDEGLGQLMIAIFSWVAKQERLRISERTKAGLATARAAGKKVGRPKGKKDSNKRAKGGYYLAWETRKGKKNG